METKTFKQRRQNILSVFSQARQDLISLNTEIEKAVEANRQEFERIRAENDAMLEMRDENTKVLKFFSKVLG